MLAGQIFVSTVFAFISLAISVASGHPPLIWLLCYSLAGIGGLLALTLAHLQRDQNGM